MDEETLKQTIEELKTALTKAENDLKKLETPEFFKPKINETYVYITNDLAVINVQNAFNGYDISKQKVGNCFQLNKREPLKQLAERWKIELALLQYGGVLRTDDPEYPCSFYISTDRLIIVYDNSKNLSSTFPRFKSRNAAQQAVELVGKERILRAYK